jgi:hypothetical protein
MKAAMVRTWEMALRSLGYGEVSRQFGADAPTVAGVVIGSADATGEVRPSKPALPLGCVFAVRYSSR